MEINQAFAAFPVLITDRFKLRQIESRDSNSLYSYFSMDEVTEFYDLDTFNDEQQAIELINRFRERFEKKEQIRWAITLNNSDYLIGTCGFHSIESEHKKVEIGYELHPQYWGQGIMSEVIGVVIHYGFHTIGLNRIEAFYDPQNIASARVLEKNGFEFEGVLKKRFFEKGKFVDAAISAIIKDNYQKESFY